MGWIKMDLEKSGGDFLSVNSFLPKLKRYLLDLSVLCMKIMELFHAIDVEEACEVYKNRNIRQFVMAEWDRLVKHCSNDLPVTVS